ncbi:MAG: arginase [Blastocatellia bacterium]|nr:arginase [Blastocatellia bacterium]MCS7156932.1 arginase [Blastocatellia bacterium]MDW8167624.1 arginase [Acidobacteriota bacterium]MDW8256224.1 arginase [Acidobacteriota bacterium]
MKRPIKIIGVPMDLGANRRGVDMGPSALRIAGLQPRLIQLGYIVEDLGNLPVNIPEVLRITDPRMKYLAEVADVNRLLADRVEQVVAEGAIPLVLGGDQSISIGTIAGLASHYHRRGEKIGVLWFDAHADMNTPETTPSGNIHGMPYAVSLGLGVPELTDLKGFRPKLDPSCCVLIGVRDVDPLERENIRRSGIAVFTMRELDELGMRAVMERAIEIASRGTVGFHVSLDMDFFDPFYAPGVGTPVPGGATYREGHLAMELIADSQKLLSLEIVEVNPVLDVRNHTAEFAVELALSAFGKRIL